MCFWWLQQYMYVWFQNSKMVSFLPDNNTDDGMCDMSHQTFCWRDKKSWNILLKSTNSLILRPVIGLNKQETIDIAEKIGTYDISILPYADCCSYLVAKHPQTKGKLAQVAKFEKNMYIDKLIIEAIKKVEVKIFK